MKNVTVRKIELITRLTENLEAHKADFKEAHEAWKVESIKFHQARIHDIENDISVGALAQDKLEPAEPASFIKNYNQALEMLQMEVSEEVTITGHEFRQYVQDEWDFTSHFRNTVSGYTGKSFS